MSKLAIVLSHPVQYYSPLFRYLAGRMDMKVFYCHRPDEHQQGADGFGVPFTWDTDLLGGYDHVFLENAAARPSVSSFFGCDTPGIGDALREARITHTVIFGWNLKAYWQAFNFCRKENIPVAVRGDSQTNPGQNPVLRLLKRAVYPFFIRKYDALFYVGQMNRAYLVDHGARSGQLVYSPHAVDREHWMRQSTERSDQSKPFVFLWVGKFIHKKRPADAIRAFKLVSGAYGSVELRMVGTGALLRQCKRSADIEGCNVHFHGFRNQSELRKYYAEADCLLLTSDFRETWGLVVNEAFACGTPAIVSDACGCSADMIAEDRSGYVYRSGKVEELAEKMRRCIGRLRENPHHFRPHIEAVNRIHSFEAIAGGFRSFTGQNAER